MWRTILLGKMAISILASIAVGVVCIMHSQNAEFTFGQAAKWIGIGTFFCLLAIVQVAVVFLLSRKKQSKAS